MNYPPCGNKSTSEYLCVLNSNEPLWDVIILLNITFMGSQLVDERWGGEQLQIVWV